MGIVRDDRGSKKTPPYGYVVATDSFMSGWGQAKGKSYYALAARTYAEAYLLMENLKDRHEMKRVRWVRTLPRLGAHDHLTVADWKIAPRYYQSGRPFRERDARRSKASKPWTRREIGVADAVAWHMRGSKLCVFWFGTGSRLWIGMPRGNLSTVSHPSGDGYYPTMREAEAAVLRVFG